VLLIDEVDSFLQDRRGAQRSWEVSQVNEMLTQMEAFAGVFIASTNLMGQLDQAALRRFDLSVKFDYLRPDAVRQLFDRYSKLLFIDRRSGAKKRLKNVACATLTCGDDAVHARLARLHHLTPGDFAAVVRQSRLRPIGSPTAMVGALEQACALKDVGAHAAIGFLA
jgi:SpoVK/Ycf46/Vps4 family AAA+-type ATPase